MKKLIALLLALVLALSLAACSGDKPAETQVTENNATQATSQTNPTEEEAPNALSFSFTQYGNARITTSSSTMTRSSSLSVSAV